MTQEKLIELAKAYEAFIPEQVATILESKTRIKGGELYISVTDIDENGEDVELELIGSEAMQVAKRMFPCLFMDHVIEGL